jgi:naphtho-gamma-pyrone polyketide synthase
VHTQDKVSRALRDMASRERGIDIEEISKLSAEIGIKEVDSPVQPPSRVSNSVILQGSPRTATKNFFLIPDGGGFSHLLYRDPRYLPDICVFRLNSPFMKTPEEYTIDIPGIALKFVTEIRRRQPNVPMCSDAGPSAA